MTLRFDLDFCFLEELLCEIGELQVLNVAVDLAGILLKITEELFDIVSFTESECCLIDNCFDISTGALTNLLATCQQARVFILIITIISTFLPFSIHFVEDVHIELSGLFSFSFEYFPLVDLSDGCSLDLLANNSNAFLFCLPR